MEMGTKWHSEEQLMLSMNLQFPYQLESINTLRNPNLEFEILKSAAVAKFRKMVKIICTVGYRSALSSLPAIL
jgi:hypothetical protein